MSKNSIKKRFHYAKTFHRINISVKTKSYKIILFIEEFFNKKLHLKKSFDRKALF